MAENFASTHVRRWPPARAKAVDEINGSETGGLPATQRVISFFVHAARPCDVISSNPGLAARTLWQTLT